MASSCKSQDDDDYWASSSATKLKKGRNLFDESVNVDDVKRQLQTVNFEDSDAATETVNWDGSQLKDTSAACAVQYHSVRQSTGVSSVRSSAHQRPIFQSKDAPVDFQAVSPSIDDVVGASRNPATHTQIASLESQVNLLKRQLQASKKDRWQKLAPRDTVKRIIFGEEYSLEGYTSKEDKLALLDEAIKLHDGNAIISVVLFVKNTLTASIFETQLALRPVAMEHYIVHLKLMHEVDTLVKILRMLGRTEEAGMLRLGQALSRKSGEARLRALQDCHSAHFRPESKLTAEAGFLQQEIALIERQLPIEQQDLEEVERKSRVFVEHPRQSSLLDQPLVTTLYYCCVYHYNLSENCLASPTAIKKAYQLTERQYMWTALRARAKLHRWQDVETLFQTKSWIGGVKLKAPIGFDRVLQLLQKVNAPREVCNKYCDLLDDLELQVQLGEKYNCYESVIKALSLLKDRQKLSDYQQKLTPNSQQWFLAASVLQNTSIKWKN